MSLEKQILIGEMTVGQLCDISVRTDTVIIDTDENGVSKEVSRSFHRHVVSPGDDVSEEAESVQSTANALWTPEVIAAWEAAQPAPEPEPTPVEEPVVEEGE
tara:strand:- start:1 stop:306 length:306 start_codon:yes stop_codon:yes gene_type:complete